MGHSRPSLGDFQDAAAGAKDRWQDWPSLAQGQSQGKSASLRNPKLSPLGQNVLPTINTRPPFHGSAGRAYLIERPRLRREIKFGVFRTSQLRSRIILLLYSLDDSMTFEQEIVLDRVGWESVAV